MPLISEIRFLASLLLVVLLSMAAQPITAQEVDAGDAVEFNNYRIDGGRSWIRVLVYRGGLLRGLGHNHVVSHHAISGEATVGADLSKARAVLELAVADFVVDDAEVRQSEGDSFPGQVSQKDIDATRNNMLGRKLLDVENYSMIAIELSELAGDLPDVELVARISVKDYDATLTLPATINIDDAGFTAHGEFTIRHGDLGLSAFKAALGALRVRDELTIRFQFYGSKTPLPPVAEH